MLKQACIMVSRALMSASYGVNKQLDQMQTLGYFGTTPFTERPQALTAALNPYESRSLADGDEYAETPFVIVSIDGPYSGLVRHPDEDSVWRETDGIAVAVRLISGDGDGELAYRHADNLTRAIVWSLRALFQEGHEADRVLDGIVLLDCQRLLYGPVQEKYGPATVTAAVVLTVRTRDFAD